jgi:hypothetical protein
MVRLCRCIEFLDQCISQIHRYSHIQKRTASKD